MHLAALSALLLRREFLRSKMAGLLHVTIRRAVSLPAADPAPFTSDPYLVVCVGDSCFTTRTILNNLNPEWHESCTLFVRWGRDGAPACCACPEVVQKPGALLVTACHAGTLGARLLLAHAWLGDWLGAWIGHCSSCLLVPGAVQGPQAADTDCARLRLRLWG